MTTDELKKEAEESFEKYRVTDIDYVVSPYSEDEGEKNLMFNNEYDAEEEYYRLYSKGYIASAEPREKRIAELERKLKVETELSNRLGLAYREYEQLTKEQDEHLAKLEKENAELRLLKDVHKVSSSLVSDIAIEKQDQLTKAKEIIKELVRVEYAEFTNGDYSNELSKVLEQAEQFLSEVEK